jgi:hypothetical protein
MITVAIYIEDSVTLEFNRIDLFSDEKISVVSSVQQISDIAKTFTDYSQTFTIPASVANNKIFRHWYDNSNNNFFSTLIKANAYIEIDTILFRKGKIQLESCNIINGVTQDYSITFIGTLGNLKDIFAGKYLKDLTDTTYDFPYSQDNVLLKITSNTDTVPPSRDVHFPLISSKELWQYGTTTGYDIGTASEPIRTNELFPAIRVKSILNMIETEFGINFAGGFMTDYRLLPLFMLLKNSDVFTPTPYLQKISLATFQYYDTAGQPVPSVTGYSVDLVNDRLTSVDAPSTFLTKPWYQRNLYMLNDSMPIGTKYSFYIYKNGQYFMHKDFITTSTGTTAYRIETIVPIGGSTQYVQSATGYLGSGDYFEFYYGSLSGITTGATVIGSMTYYDGNNFSVPRVIADSDPIIIPDYKLPIKNYFPEMKIEDFFSGLLKMFNLTCTSKDGITYEIETIDNYYANGFFVDITKYIVSDKKALNRVKTYKKINFEYEKSESLINVGFSSANGIEYGSLFYTPVPPSDGEEYNIKLPFETLNFSNLTQIFQVGYLLKTDYQPYIPKPILLYASILDGNYVVDMSSPAVTYYVSTNPTGNGTGYQMYRPFGQENYTTTDSYSINFNEQQSTLTNLVCEKSLYNQYYENYLGNVFTPRARLLKVKAILPNSILTSLKLNDRIIIKDARYIINTMTTDLTSGEVQFELLTDFRTI